MEKLVIMPTYFKDTYRNRKVLITGHTGFKGSWLSYWLWKLDAEVSGYALAPETVPNHFDLLKTPIKSYIYNLSNYDALINAVNETNPEIVFHLAAQPYVRYSYKNPKETYNTNVIGTLNVLEAARQNNNIKAVVVITTDKVYENNEWNRGYIEIDRLGGHDPYSSSKACCEILINSYRNSFFKKGNSENENKALIATARAGNVIGGGDWGQDRLIPDIVKNAYRKTETFIRNPDAVRPWQHVLESLSGYLLLGEKLLNGKMEFAEAWNFGPAVDENNSVRDVGEFSQEIWDKIILNYNENQQNLLHETKILKIDSTKANSKLPWIPVLNNEEAIEKAILWYREFYENKSVITEKQLMQYLQKAESKNVSWIE
jgi:CDP-glucose 4,6-dehydratase